MSLVTFGTTQHVNECLGSLPSDYTLCACTKAGMCICMAVCMFVLTYACMYVCMYGLHTDADAHTQIPDNHAGLCWHAQLANHIPWNNWDELYLEYQTWRWQGILKTKSEEGGSHSLRQSKHSTKATHAENKIWRGGSHSLRPSKHRTKATHPENNIRRGGFPQLASILYMYVYCS